MPMADIYAAVWHRSRSVQFDSVSISSILDDVPVMNPLPKRAPENNHLQDSKSTLDKLHQGWQQVHGTTASLSVCVPINMHTPSIVSWIWPGKKEKTGLVELNLLISESGP